MAEEPQYIDRLQAERGLGLVVLVLHFGSAAACLSFPSDLTHHRSTMKIHHLTPGLLALALASCQTIETDRDLFVKCDTDKDGRLSREEVCTMGYPRIFGRFDPDGDGRVTLADVKTRQPDFDPKLFAERDLNSDGAVTFGEYCKVADRKGGIPELFAKVDTNGDGYIDKTEAQAHVASLGAVNKP